MTKETPDPASPPPRARRAWRLALWLLLALSLAGMAYLGSQMGPLDSWLRAARGADGQLVSPHGIVDLELAFSDARAERIVAAWRVGHREDGTTLLSLADRSLHLDYWLILSYVLALLALCLLVAPSFSRDRRRIWHQITALPVLAGLLDVVENLRLDELLHGEAFGLPLGASAAAAAKFLLLAATLIALIILAFAWLGRWLSQPRTAMASPLSVVVDAERPYLTQRRERAGVDTAGEPIGLALSGGGIRSATINLGVLQALARRRVLPWFDYLSTVSGGGYIGSALSSLLSINGARLDAARRGDESQYSFERRADGEDRAHFTTEDGSFPFDERNRQIATPGGGVLDGRAQMRHLRAAGEFLVGRRSLFSIEMLRVIGGVLVGVLYHLVHFGLFLVALAAGYLWVAYLMVGERATRAAQEAAARAERLFGPGAAESIPLSQQYRRFVREAFGMTVDWNWDHPFLQAAVAGAVTTGVTLGLAYLLLRRLPSGWFERPGLTEERSRNLAAVFAMLLTMVTVGFSLAFWVRAALPNNLLNVSVPLVSYLGGGLCLAVGHGFVKTNRNLRRWDRSRLAAQEGGFVLLVAVSLALVLLILPFLVFFDLLVNYLSDRPLGSLFGWLLTLLGARMFAEGDPAAGARGAIGRFLAGFPALRKALLGLVVFAAVVGGLLLICVRIWRLEPLTAPGTYRITLSLTATVLYLLSSRLDFNRLSLSFFYRDRLTEAYLRTTEPDPDRANMLRVLRDNETLRLSRLHGLRQAWGPDECVTSAPYHLLVTCLNLGADQRPKQATRKTDQFVFSRLYCGSETTGFVRTSDYRGDSTELADAVTISGAAASPAMGRRTFFAQSAAMTLLNVRLGQWMENPAWKDGTAVRSTFWPPYLLREILAGGDANRRLLYLSDGGHSGDNLGICPLLRRRCRLILAVDAEYDPAVSGNSLVEALRQIRLDEGIEVDIDLGPLRPGEDGAPSTTHFVCGRIEYPEKVVETEDEAEDGRGDTPAKTIPSSSGWLIVIKSSLTGDEPEMIANYQRNNPAFPHQTTGDLFFDDAQFEAYRQLGEHMVDDLLDTSRTCREALSPRS